jgi:hypothetical protein
MGIYLLGYSDATHYIGQAVDVVRRFGGHRRLSPDIESFAFISTRRASLDNAEQNAIHYAEALRVRLRNRVHVADVLGPVDLDELVPEDSQHRWLNDPDVEIIDAAEPVMLPPDSPQRWRTDPQFRQLAARPEYAAVQRIVADFIGRCIPAPATTQLSYWSLTALPSTNKLHHPRFGCLNVNMMEVLVCGWLPGSGADLWGFMNVAESGLPASFGSENAFAEAFPSVIRRRRLYRAAGGDDCLLEVPGLDLLRQLVQDPRIQAAARALTLRLMRKGPTIYGRYHCPAFADDALRRSNDSV